MSGYSHTRNARKERANREETNGTSDCFILPYLSQNVQISLMYYALFYCFPVRSVVKYRAEKLRGYTMKQVDIYTDGACRGNPGPGGFGAILVFAGIEKEFSGGEAQTTNNRMELLAAITALSALKEPCAVTLYSDSKYLVDAINQNWVYGWRKKGWKKSDGKPALNIDLWERLLTLLETHRVRFIWVKGHNGHPYNERCDRLAVKEAEKYTL